jgi:hypothetical protein
MLMSAPTRHARLATPHNTALRSASHPCKHNAQGQSTAEVGGSSPPRPTICGSKPPCAQHSRISKYRGGLGRVKGHVDVDTQGGIS